MAEVPKTRIEHPHTGNVNLYKWVLTALDTGEPIIVPRFSDVSVHIFGTFGGAVTIEGSLDPAEDGSTFVELRDNQGNILSFTAAAMASIQENTYQIRPRAASGVTSVTVIMMVR